MAAGSGTVQVDNEIFTKNPDSGSYWKVDLSQILGVRSLDFPSNALNFAKESDKTNVTLMSPKVTTGVLENAPEFAYSSQGNSIKPFPGANMWSLRDFRI